MIDCTFLLRDETLPGAAGDGIWTQLGYSIDGVTYGGGGTTLDLFGDNPIIDPSSMDAGFYKLAYSDGCNPAQVVYIRVVAGAKSGTPTALTYCINSGNVVNLFDGLANESVGGTWAVSPQSVPPGTAFNAVNGTLTLSQLTVAGTYLFTYTVTTPELPGYDLMECQWCTQISQVTVNVTPAFNAGGDNSIVVTSTTGALNLYDQLLGVPDNGGSWQQIGSSSVAISGGHLGTINLNAATGCSFVFVYSGGSGACYDSAIVTIQKTVNYSLAISYASPVMTATYSGCASPTFQWYTKVGLNWNIISGATAATYSTTVVGDYRVVMNCGGCTQQAEYSVQPPACNNTACFNAVQYLFPSLGSYYYQVTPNGVQTSPVVTDVFEYSSQGGAWQTFDAINGYLSGCDVAESFHVVPYCTVNGTKIRVGYDQFFSCPDRQVDALSWEFGNGTQGNAFGAIDAYDLEYTPAEWIAKGRSLTFRVRVNTPIGVLVRYFTFNYTGTTQVNCNNIVITEGADPVLFYPIAIRRTVTFSDGCPSVGCTLAYNQVQTCDALDVYISKCTGSGSLGAGLCATVINCPSGSTITRQWYKNGVILAGETGLFIPETYGVGEYSVTVSCGGCIKTDFFSLQLVTCTLGVAITPGSGVHIATVTDCPGTPTYQWSFKYDNSSTWITLGTAQSQANTLVGGTYKVTVTCGSCVASSTKYIAEPCTSVSVSIGASGSTLTATSSGCPVATPPTFAWSYQQTNGSFLALGTSATQNASQGGGLYKVVIACGACSATATYQFTPTCNVNAIITSNGAPLPILTGSATGCVGTISYTWHVLNNGVAWVQVATTQQYTPTVQGLYRLTINCGGCSDTELYNYSNCAASVTITTSGSTLTAVPAGCSGTVTYSWELSINSGVSWSPLSSSQTVTASQNGVYRVTISCGGCVANAQLNFTTACTNSVSLAYNSSLNLLMATTSGCSSGLSVIWQFSPNYNPTSQGCTGWSQVASGVSVYTPTATGCYRVITFCGGTGVCPSEATLYVVIANPCTGLSLAMSSTGSSLNFGTLQLNGVNVTNYQISWRDASNVELFKSGAGTGFNANTYPHPSSNIPVPAGTLKPYILTSSVGNNLDCFTPITITGFTCATGYSITYNGAGGVSAQNDVSIQVGATTGFLKIYFLTYSVADTLTVIYNGATILTTGSIVSWGVVYLVPITYVSGQNTATVRVTNSNPAVNTQYQLQVKCCQTETPCPVPLPVVSLSSTGEDATTCSCSVILNFGYENMLGAYNALCKSISDYGQNYSSQIGGCSEAFVDMAYSCINCGVTVVKNAGASYTMTFDSACSAKYTSIKAALQSITSPYHYLRVTLKSNPCGSDGGYNAFNIYKVHSTITYNDTLMAITVSMPATNPYPDNCSNCSKVLRSSYANEYANANNASSAYYTTAFTGVYGYDVRTATQVNVADADFFESITTPCGVLENKYRLSFRNTNCPCQSWQIFQDVDNNGSYETLRLQASNWSGSCV